VFFVLSGFVLAPQIVREVVGGPWRNLGVFLVRRWMRTIPPYVVALVAIALITGNLLTGDFARYLVYAENLTHMAVANDFYPVAWSLGVEEWFYLLFAPMLFVVGLLLGRSDRRLEIGFAVAFIIVVAALRHFFAPANWDLDVRRVMLFRIDSIVWGYLLFLALEKRSGLAVAREWGLAALGAATAAVTALELAIAYRALLGESWAQNFFPYASALFGMTWVAAFRLAEPAFSGQGVRALSFWLGRISYSAYLFHLLLVILLKPVLAGWPLAAQLALYVALICAFSTLFWRGFEKPILAARPRYASSLLPRGEGVGPQSVERRAASRTPYGPTDEGAEGPARYASPHPGLRAAFSPRGKRVASSRLVAPVLGLALIGAIVVARNAFMGNAPYLFYPALVVIGALSVGLAERAGRFARGCGAAARTLLLFALMLPAADAVYRASTGVPLKASIAAPTYSYRAASENPAAFATWWFYYLNEWIRPDGIRREIDAPDPQGKLPFVMKPGSSGRMFDTTLHINHAGFRGPEIAADKGDRFLIFALGESQTFGPTLREGEKPWPEQLQALFGRAQCDRPVEIVNAGTEAYSLKDNLERVRRDILPLRPDLVVSTHGMNGLLPFGLRQVPEPNEPGVRPRASALLGRAVFSLERAAWRFRTRNAAPQSEPPPFTDAALLASRYADEYRQLIALGRENDVPIALATSDMAVAENSPRAVKDFYGAVFKPIDDIIAANAAHNRLVEMIGREEDVPVIDMRPGLDGNWDDDMFLDTVHFTERGNARAAKTMFDGLLPILAQQGVRCRVD
jgi:peptidoglycan/LPS O-acetylase OafA/YrhL/lysophospholipase L1-like esterase